MREKTIDIRQITQTIRENFPNVPFAYLFGSAKDGAVKPGSDIDIAANRFYRLRQLTRVALHRTITLRKREDCLY
ncbi:MAG: nucleotidyltransferase domain-containing protein [Prevotellaceae bacterium]|nr:nucleotidyltransferase domain-containing protein [Prevotellaceae bacterium]